MLRPETRYARSGEVHIAYQVSGSGPWDLVWAPGTTSHLDIQWDTNAPMYERFGSTCRLIRFDKRGTGLSDRPTAVATLEERTDDIRAVMDAASSERAVVFGLSEGGSMACMFAALYPERTRALVVWGAQARWVQAGDYPWGLTPEDSRRLIEDIRANWPSEWYIRGPGNGLGPDATIADVETTARRLRAGASPAAAAALEEMNAQIDTRDILPTIQVPSLVMNRTGDPVAQVDAARDLARRIPGARFVEFPGRTHGFGDIVEEVVGAIEEFVTGVKPATTNRVLTTLLSLDIAGSTELAARIGDAAWRRRLDGFYDVVEKELGAFAGVEVDRAGDGILATFDGPGRAVRAAQAIQRGVRDLDMRARAGIHTGEVERVDPGVRGLAVHIAARVAALASPDEVLVTSTVRDLVAGSQLRFEDRGFQALKGIPDQRQLLAVMPAQA